jgi:dTDP-L-rhamnose 4-epimerase
MRVLITGGMGFIGKAVTRRLLKTDCESILVIDNLLPKIHGITAQPADFHDRRVSFYKGDISCREEIGTLLLSSDIILHLAAETGTGQSMYDIEHYAKVNISGTALLLDILTNNSRRVQKIVLASSRAIYGEGKYKCASHGIVYPLPRSAEDMSKGDFNVKCPICCETAEAMATSEDSLIHPASFYGITKQVQEAMVMTLCPNIGIAPVALRYQNVYGPGQSLENPYTGILSIFSNRIRLNKDIEIFEDGQESRDFVFIDDVADVTVDAIFSDNANGQVLNVGSGNPITVLSIAEKLRRLFNVGIDININGKFRFGDIRHNYADLAKTSEILNFRPETNIDQGLAKFIDWVTQQEAGADLYESALSEIGDRGLYK